MLALPLPARLYLSLTVAVASLLGALAAAQAQQILAAPIPALLAFVGLLLAYGAEVRFESPGGQTITFTADDALVIFCLSTLGPPGVLVAVAAFILSQLLHRKPLERLLFNAAMLCVTYMITSLVYRLFQPAGGIPFVGALGVAGFLFMAGVYYASNALLVSIMVALASQRPVLQIYRESLLQASWVHLLTYAIGVGMAALYAVDPWLLVYGVITLVVARYAFATAVALNTETRRRHELAEERARLYEEQARLNQELSRASRLAELGTFSAGIAHEFNNLLTAIQGHAQMAQNAETFAEKDFSLDLICRITYRATSITSSLLTFARQREPDLALSRLQSAIAETIELLRPDLTQSAITLHEEIADLPPIQCDIGQLNQVLLNLLTNARDALHGREDAELRINLSQADDQAVITIADNGPGMSSDTIDKLFQPFVTTKKKGNGLGMAICYGIVQGHKGKIDVASELGKGTVITIRLPMCCEEPPAVIVEPDLAAAA